MSRIVTTIDKTGPFFQHDPVKTFQANVETMMAAVAEQAERDIKTQMEAGNSTREPISRLGGHVSEHVRGRVESLAGKRWHQTAVASVNNSGFSAENGIALMAAASTVEGKVHAFRKTASRIRSSRAVNQAELLKGIQ